MSISQKSAQGSHEAVLFFEDAEVSREMLYSEFEALLDGVVPVHGLAGRELRAAYVRLDAGLAPAVIVLFLLPFDQEGFPEQRWNLPLRQLADASHGSPDASARGARVACSSQCPLRGWERGLWDPVHGPGGSTFDTIRRRLGMNRLGFEASAGPAAAASEYASPAPPLAATPPEHRGEARPAQASGDPDAMLAVVRQSNLQMSLLREQSQRELSEMQQRLAEFRQRCQELENGRQEAGAEIERLRAAATVEHDAMRAELDAASAEIGRLAALEIELRDALGRSERESAEAREALRAELARQEEKVQSLSAELTVLRRDKLRLMDDGAEGFFAALKEKNVNFVSFQPGAGHITIPTDDLSRFLEATDDYVASKCKVSTEHYRRWLQHYANPVCQGTAGSGAPCAKAVTKVLKPAEFTSGLHDRCEIHKQVPRSQTLKDRDP